MLINMKNWWYDWIWYDWEQEPQQFLQLVFLAVNSKLAEVNKKLLWSFANCFSFGQMCDSRFVPFLVQAMNDLHLGSKLEPQDLSIRKYNVV